VSISIQFNDSKSYKNIIKNVTNVQQCGSVRVSPATGTVNVLPLCTSVIAMLFHSRPSRLFITAYAAICRENVGDRRPVAARVAGNTPTILFSQSVYSISSLFRRLETKLWACQTVAVLNMFSVLKPIMRRVLQRLCCPVANPHLKQAVISTERWTS